MFKAAVATVMSLSVLVGSCCADVIGSKPRAGQNVESKVAVAKRLGALGLHPEDIRQQVNSLTDRNLAYLAAHPESLRLAGAQETPQGSEFFTGDASPTWYELVFGGLFIVGTVVWLIIISGR